MMGIVESKFSTQTRRDLMSQALRSTLLSVPVLFATACTQPQPQRSDDVAARVGSTSITLDQVDAQVRKAEPETWQSLFDARRRSLARLIDEQLLSAEARTQGIDVDSLVTREVSANVPAVSDEDVKVFYAQNEQRMGGESLEAMQQRLRDYLSGTHHRQTQRDYLASLRQQAGVEILLEPPRALIQVADDEPAKGPADAPIVLVEYSDYECPYCARAQPSVRQVLQTYGDRIRHVYRDFPLAMHDDAHLAAQAGQCAGEQGRFWEYHDLLFTNSRALRPADLQRYAESIDLDPDLFAECLDSGRHAHGVDADLESGQQHGVSGTPAFFINGRLLSGAQPFAAFQKIIDEELESAGQAGL
jgi:protein-disulfide isomerase